MIYKKTNGVFPKKYEIKIVKKYGIIFSVDVWCHNVGDFNGLVAPKYKIGSFKNKKEAMEYLDKLNSIKMKENEKAYRENCHYPLKIVFGREKIKEDK